MPRTKAGQVAASWLLHQELHGPTSTLYHDEHCPRTPTLTALFFFSSDKTTGSTPPGNPSISIGNWDLQLQSPQTVT